MSDIYSGYVAYIGSSVLFNTVGYSASKQAGLVSGKVKRVLDDCGSASFKLPVENSHSSDISVGDDISIYLVKGDVRRMVFWGYVSNIERDVYGDATVSAIEYIGHLKLTKSGFLDEWTSFSAAVFAGMYQTVDSVPFSDTVYDDFSARFVLSLGGDTCTTFEFLSEVMTAGGRWGVGTPYHFWLSGPNDDGNGRVITVSSESSMTVNSQTVELGKNITDISTEETMPDATILTVTGKDFDGNDVTFTGYGGNTNMVACSSTVSSFKVYGEYDMGAGYSSSTLKSISQNYINSIGVIQTGFTITAVDLSFTDSTITPFEIGQMVRVISSKHGIDGTVPISELTIDMCNPLKTSISVGSAKPRITGQEYARRASVKKKT